MVVSKKKRTIKRLHNKERETDIQFKRQLATPDNKELTGKQPEEGMNIEEEKEQNKSTEYVQNKETVNNTATQQPNEKFQKESYVIENNVLIKEVISSQEVITGNNNNIRKRTVRYSKMTKGQCAIIAKLKKSQTTNKCGKNQVKILMHLMKYNIVPRELAMEKFNTAKIVFDNYNDANICLDKIERRSIEDKEKVTAYIEERFTKCRGVITDWE